MPLATASEAGASGTGGVNADALREYRMSLASAARRFRRYPTLARERAWEGAPEVLIRFNGGSSLPEVALGASSGRAVLDDQAVEMIRQAARVTELPAKLRDRDFLVRMPVRFSLEDE